MAGPSHPGWYCHRTMKTLSSAEADSGRADEGWAVITTLFAGLVLWGGIGWVLDRWLHTSFFVVVGVLVGMVLSIYAVVFRYGGRPAPASLPATSQQSPWVATWDSHLVHKSPVLADAVPTRREIECP